MNCPRCNDAFLIELDRDGVTVDRCERCRGIWLDRGELEKLLGRAREADAMPREARGAPPARAPRDDDDDRRRRDDDDDRGHAGGRKRSWWDIFD